MRAKRLNSKSNIIGKNVKKYRTANKYTQEELCQKLDLFGLNLYHSDIYLIEYNKRIVRDYEALALAFAKVFNISLDELYSGTEKELE
ncbi:MAG: helix-turn-helix transcriptional regulator [Clostridia bacterium]|nr:helix-turn-helix transcriptional regulator [Clostridia bacterium]